MTTNNVGPGGYIQNKHTPACESGVCTGCVPAPVAPMVVELQKFKHSDKFSEETLCFNADIYVDGKKAGFVSNEGRGGSCSIQFLDLGMRSRFNEYLKTLPPEKADFGEIKIDADYFFARLAAETLTKKREQKLILKATKLGMKAYIVTVNNSVSYEILLPVPTAEAQLKAQITQLAAKHKTKAENLKVKAL